MPYFFIVLMALLLNGCAAPSPALSGSLYAAPDGRFTLTLPDDWTQTEALSEVQFWDSFDDGVNSVKLVLISTDFSSLNAVESRTETGIPFEHTFESTTLNTVPVLIETGLNERSHYRTYYYGLKDGVVALNALFQDDNATIDAQAKTVQDSFTPLSRKD